MSVRPALITVVALIVFASLIVILPAQAGPDNVAPNSHAVCPLKVGETLPSITLTDVQGRAVDLNVEVARQPTVLVVYRGGWCPYCNTQLSALAEVKGDLAELGYQIIAVSADRPAKLRETLGEVEPGYTLLSDSSQTAAAKLGLAFQVDDETVTRYEQWDIDLDDASGESHHVLPVPAVFVLDTDGVVQFQYVNPNYKVRLDEGVLLAAAKAAVAK